jgi:PAT family beta-lactamase induction signal transducer AmpG
MNRPSLKAILSDRTLALMLALGFSSGLPFLLVLGTQLVRLTEAKVPIETVGHASWVGLCYSTKFLWSPVIDEFDVPGLSRLLGRRRAWMLVAQLGIAAGLVGQAFADPTHGFAFLIVIATFTAFCAATQDIAIDGWRIDAAPPEAQGVMAATSNFGYRLGLLCAGALTLYIADFAGWRTAYLSMACLVPVGIVACLASSPQPTRDKAERAVHDFVPTPAIVGGFRIGVFVLCAMLFSTLKIIGWLNPWALALVMTALAVFLSLMAEELLAKPAMRSYIAPIVELALRFGWLLVAMLLLVALYRLPDFLTGVMANPLYIKLGFSKSEIATMTKFYAIWIGIAGAFAGGFTITRFGLMPALIVGGIAASSSHLALALLAASGKSLPLLALAVSVESFAGSFAGAALIAYMSSLTTPAFAASQYALLSSLYALLGKFFGGFSGDAVKAIGFPAFFTASSTIGIPVTLLCLLVWARQRSVSTQAAREAAPAG